MDVGVALVEKKELGPIEGQTTNFRWTGVLKIHSEFYRWWWTLVGVAARRVADADGRTVLAWPQCAPA